MQDDPPRTSEPARPKKKKKRKPSTAASRIASNPDVVVPPLPPPPASTPNASFVLICLACALLGAFAYHFVVKGRAPVGDASADSQAAQAGDPTATPTDVAAPPADAKKTASGLAYRVLKPGDDSKRPTSSDRVRVHYAGWSKDGKLFDSSYTRGTPATFGVTEVIKGWTEGLQLMSVGEKTRFWIPAELAYGEKPTREGVPAGMLVFDVELVSIE